MRAMRDLGREPDFCELISEWLPWWEEAGLPYIPVEEIGRAPAEEWLAGIEDLWSPAVSKSMKAASETDPNAMVRWDHCSGDYLKLMMDGGASSFSGRVPKTLDDIRFYELTELFICHHGLQAEIILWRRPWVRGQVVDGYPLEFRAYVFDGQIQGVSSYYPQRPLPAIHVREAQQVWALTERLLGLGPPGSQDSPRESLGSRPRDFTCDWLVREDGQAIIIECGPPHIPTKPWAHPCCFRTGEVEGIALWAQPGSEAEEENKRRAEQEPLVSWYIERGQQPG